MRVPAPVLLALALLGACDDAASAPPPGTAPPPESLPLEEALTRLPQVLARTYDVPPAELDAVNRDGSEFEQSLLADGTLTYAEYERAFLARNQCLRDGGIETAPNAEVSVLARFDDVVPVPKQLGLEQGTALIERCSKQYFYYVSRAWNSATQDHASAVIEGARRWMAACLVASGVRGADEPARSTNPEVASAYAECLGEMQQAYRLGSLSFGVADE